jgi:hypothetical protein
MKQVKWMALVSAASLVVACGGSNQDSDVPESDGPAENAGEEIDEAAEGAEEATEEAAEETAEEVEEAGDEMEEAFEE